MNQDFGIIGLAVMGRNLALNIERNGYGVSVYNITRDLTDAFMSGPGAGKRFEAPADLAGFVKSLVRPRRVLMMIKAGEPVDQMLGLLLPILEKGDVVIDGGNSLHTDTERRCTVAAAAGIHFVGMGVSGGEEGALWGPSLMPGGAEESYRALEPVLKKIAATSDSGPCVAYMGRGGAGHFVKMVHNGIEYGDMQLISESYQLLKQGLGLSPGEVAKNFLDWNNGPLQSYLIEITARIVDFPDDAVAGKPLVEHILDKAGQKGTGRWTIEAALAEGVAIPTIAAAVDARALSSIKEERVKASRVYPQLHRISAARPVAVSSAQIASALYASKICSYAQGFALLAAAGRGRNYGLNLSEVARIWKGGCIIRAKFLDTIRTAFGREPGLTNLLLDAGFAAEMARAYDAWREVIVFAYAQGIPVPAMSASFAYFNSYVSEKLPANIIQAQRDYFGAHTYERTDKPGVFHTQWVTARSGA